MFKRSMVASAIAGACRHRHVRHLRRPQDGASGADGMVLSPKNFPGVVPCREGAVRMFKERGVWTGVAKKHNAALIQRRQLRRPMTRSSSRAG